MIISDVLILGTSDLANIAASGSIGAAVATVDKYSSQRLLQSTPGVSLTLPIPTTPVIGQEYRLTNAGTTSVTVAGVAIGVQQAGLWAWSGTAWAEIVTAQRSVNASCIILKPSGGDDTAVIQSAFVSAKNGGCIEFSPGTYKISDTLLIKEKIGVRIQGQGGFPWVDGGGAEGGVVLQWIGAVTKPVIKMSGINCQISNMAFQAVSSFDAGVMIYNFQPSPTYSSKNTLSTLSFLGTHKQSILFTGDTADGSVDQNIEYNTIRDCSMVGYTEAAIVFRKCSQSHFNEIINCRYAGFGTTPNGKYGIKQEGNGGDFYSRSCGGGYHSVADFQFASPNPAITIDSFNSENSARLCTSEGPTGGNFSITFRGCRFDTDRLAPDREFIQLKNGGPLIIEGCNFLFKNLRPLIMLNSFSPIPSARITNSSFDVLNALAPVTDAAGDSLFVFSQFATSFAPGWRVVSQNNASRNFTTDAGTWLAFRDGTKNYHFGNPAP